ncbi:MAG: NADH-quinone oxidoreductase subunit NuoK [Planctomycetes bacterium]|nr:NADH-quinone oxidoreductase subunit NuoK [Planctomycetota bacterium]
MNVQSEHLMILAAVLFAIGVLGFLIRRNVIVVLMCIELMLNAANLTFLAASRQHSGPEGTNLVGPVFAIFVIAIAAAEAAVGLALIIALFRLRQTTEADSVQEMEG